MEIFIHFWMLTIPVLQGQMYMAYRGTASMLQYQPLGTRSICRRSRKYVFGYIAMYNFSAVYFLYFLQALFVSDFTSRTPNKDEQVEQLIYCRFV